MFYTQTELKKFGWKVEAFNVNGRNLTIADDYVPPLRDRKTAYYIAYTNRFADMPPVFAERFATAEEAWIFLEQYDFPDSYKPKK